VEDCSAPLLIGPIKNRNLETAAARFAKELGKERQRDWPYWWPVLPLHLDELAAIEIKEAKIKAAAKRGTGSKERGD